MSTERTEILEGMRRWLLALGLSPNTATQYVGTAGRWWAFTGSRPFDPEHAGRGRLEEYIADLEARSHSGVRNNVTAIRRFYRYASDVGAAHHDPTAGLIVGARAPSPVPSPRAVVLDEWATAMRRRGLSEGTIHSRIPMVRTWWGIVGDPFDPKLTWRDVERFIDGRDQRTVNARYATISHLHQFYKWARRNEYCDHDPTELVERPRTRRNLPRPMSDDDLSLAVALAEPTMRAALLLAAGCGLRCIELARLKWDDIGADTLLLRGKGGRERYVPLHPAARAALDELGRDDLYVFPWRHPAGSNAEAYHAGGRMSAAINGFLHSIGISSTAHSLRHFAGTKALRQCGDLRAVQELLGHASPATTAIYTQVNVDHLADVVNSIELPGIEQHTSERTPT